MIITEYELRANWHKTKAQVITIPQGSVITPSARDYLRSKGIRVQVQGDGELDLDKNTFSSVHKSMEFKSSLWVSEKQKPDSTRKPEHMTHLHGQGLVPKIHPIIALRGQLDLFQCQLTDTQIAFLEKGEQELAAKLDDVAEFARQIMLAEVKNMEFNLKNLLGLSLQDLRERSHNPEKFFGVKHTNLSCQDGFIVAKLHYLRAKAREVELYANRAFTSESGECSRTDIILALNRLSSALYILVCMVKGQGISKDTIPSNKVKAIQKKVPIGISNRHLHLSHNDLGKLFGSEYKLTVQKQLSQPGQFAAEETVTLVGPKGRLEKVRILGPTRNSTQVELSVTDCFKLGIDPVVRDSGFIEGTAGVTVVGPAGEIALDRGAMVAGRHIHMPADLAKEWGFSDGQRISAFVSGQRPVIFENILIRVSKDYSLEMHLDTDESNAAGTGPQAQALILDGGLL